ncbi:hydroxymethylglutaryl-CoA lyase, partial [Amycolatopsis rhizosphaerae]
MGARELGLPQRVSAGGLPARVTIWEVGPRDGLQNEKTIVPVEVKLEFLDRLGEAGLSVLEATSFVSPKWVPQLADAEQLLDGLNRRPGVRYPVLVPNERGLKRALDAGCRDLAIFGSATETFAQRNLNSTVEDQFAMFEPVAAGAREAGATVRGYLSMC